MPPLPLVSRMTTRALRGSAPSGSNRGSNRRGVGPARWPAPAAASSSRRIVVFLKHDSDSKSSSRSQSSGSDKNFADEGAISRRRRRRRLLVLSLVVATAIPAGLAQFNSRLHAQEASRAAATPANGAVMAAAATAAEVEAAAPMGNKDRLTLG